MVRAFIFTAVFISGAALMSLEMAGFRLVQPEFGSDIVVYGSLISVFLGGLALGAFAGGKLADRKPDILFLGFIFLVSGLGVVFMPLYSDNIFQMLNPVNANAGTDAFLMTLGAGEELTLYTPPDLRWATLLVGILLFFFPSVLIGMVSPYSARLLIHRLGKIGSGVGKISSVSTLGSITGTFLSTFFLIQILGTRLLITSNGIVLIVLGLASLSMRFFHSHESLQIIPAGD